MGVGRPPIRRSQLRQHVAVPLLLLPNTLSPLESPSDSWREIRLTQSRAKRRESGTNRRVLELTAWSMNSGLEQLDSIRCDPMAICLCLGRAMLSSLGSKINIEIYRFSLFDYNNIIFITIHAAAPAVVFASDGGILPLFLCGIDDLFAFFHFNEKSFIKLHLLDV